MSEFKIIGDEYISEWNGSSLNVGDADNPFSHPADCSDDSSLIAVIGAGKYNGAFTKRMRFIGDGYVEIDMINNNFPTPTVNTSISNPHYQNIIFKNCNGFNRLDNRFHYFIECVFYLKLFNIASSGLPSLQFQNCIIFPNDVLEISNSNGNKQPVFYGSMIFANTLNSIYVPASPQKALQFCYLPKGFRHVVASFSSSAHQAFFTDSMINGIINIGGVDYESKQLFDGSPRPDADPLIADIVTAPNFGNFYLNRNFSGDPKFIDVINKIVEPDSDLLNLAGPYGFIGDVRPGKIIPVNSSDPNITITTTDIDTSDSQNWIIQSPATEGFINIVWKLSDNISEVQRIFLDALLQFDGSEAGGSVGNNNVPDNFPSSYSPLSQAGLKPNRLLYEFRTSQSIAKPTTDAQWDNDNVALGTTAGDFYLQEWNTKPTITTILGVAYGNGNPESIGGSNNGINARWGHAKIRLTNNRAF